MRYTLRQLEVFLATAQYENITRAAESLMMSQSAASGALAELERQFDVQLFDRVGKRLRMSDLGHLLRPKAEALIERAREFEQDLKDPEIVGQLNLGATLTIGDYLAVDLVAKYMARFPQSQLRLEIANTQMIAQQVLNFDLDIGLIEGELHDKSLQVIPWREDDLVVFCGATHPLVHKKQLTDSDLLQAAWILRESGSGTRQAFDRAMHGLLPDLCIKLELQHTQAIKQAVRAKLGISCLSRITLENDFVRGDLVPLAVPNRNLHRALSIILHKDKYHGAAIENWIDLCKES